MELIPLKSRLLNPGDDLLKAVRNALARKKERLENGDVLVIASKAVAYSQGRLAPAKKTDEFQSLVDREADRVFGHGDMRITLKNGALIPNAGIDLSNTPEGLAVLWPTDPFGAARQLRDELMKAFSLKKLGVLITDSHCQPLRLGTTGLAIGWAGFEGVQDERGKKDLFGKPMRYTQMAVADSLASAANLLMGETDALTPFVIARGLSVKWTTKKASQNDYFVPPEECIYKEVYRL